MDHVTGTINTIKTHALIAKATSNDPKPTPGYLFPEIARLTQSPTTSSLVLTQLLKIITPSGKSNSSATHQGNAPPGTTTSSAYASSPHVLLKALKILRQLAQSGSIEFRVNLARRGKVLLAEMVGYRGTWDEIHGDRFNQDVRAVAEDLIEYMHANPVQELEQQQQQQDGSDAPNSMTEHEAAVLRGSTQDLSGFGNP
ncbi:AP-4 complex accessory subunit Tepsin, partial [Mortierella sp. NVP85]